MRKLSIFCFMVMLCLPGLARAEGDLLLGTGVGEEPPAESSQADEFSIGLGVGLGNSPYKGYDTKWSPLPIISYEGEYAYIRGFSAGIKAVNLDWLEVSAFLKYDDTSFDPSDSTDGQMRKLHNRYSSLAAGAEARLSTPYGMLYANGAGVILDHSNGFCGDVGYL